MTNIKRTPAGVPTGGEFAANEHDEAAASLDGFLFTGGDESVIEEGEASWESGGIVSVELEDGTNVRIDTGSNHPTYVEPQYQALADGTIRVKYAIPDEDPGDMDDDDPIHRFSSIDDRNDFVEKKLSEGYAPEQIQFPFLFTNGGTSSFEMRGTAAEDGWREKSFGSLDPDVLIIGDPGEQGFDMESAGRAYMRDRTAWDNGDVYGIAEVRVDRNGNGVPGHPREVYWGIIGSEEAENEVKF